MRFMMMVMPESAVAKMTEYQQVIAKGRTLARRGHRMGKAGTHVRQRGD